MAARGFPELPLADTWRRYRFRWAARGRAGEQLYFVPSDALRSRKGPGFRAALLVGIKLAPKRLPSQTWRTPVDCLNHLEGHIMRVTRAAAERRLRLAIFRALPALWCRGGHTTSFILLRLKKISGPTEYRTTPTMPRRSVSEKGSRSCWTRHPGGTESSPACTHTAIRSGQVFQVSQIKPSRTGRGLNKYG